MNKAKKNLKRRGFSLVELMVVIVIIGILGGIVTPKILESIEKANIAAAKREIAIFADACKKFKIDTKRFPEVLEELVEDPGIKGWQEGGYVEEIGLDPWDNPYEFIVNPDDKKVPFQIWSLGPNGNDDGGEGDDIAFPFVETTE